jgi:hypothetical protein
VEQHPPAHRPAVGGGEAAQVARVGDAVEVEPHARRRAAVGAAGVHLALGAAAAAQDEDRAEGDGPRGRRHQPPPQ